MSGWFILDSMMGFLDLCVAFRVSFGSDSVRGGRALILPNIRYIGDLLLKSRKKFTSKRFFSIS
jgi:hypothetical protein